MQKRKKIGEEGEGLEGWGSVGVKGFVGGGQVVGS